VVSTQELLDRVRSGDREAAEDLFAECHPPARRTLAALIGDDERAEKAVDELFRQARAVMRRWPESVDPVNWCYHRAVLAARRFGGGRHEDVADDPLVRALPIELRSPAYLAMIRALRRLGGQRAEAFILHHGERLNPRLLGVAMDCSAAAAATHLSAADTHIRALTQDQFDQLTEHLRRAVVGLTPPPAVSRQFAQAQARAWAVKQAGIGLGRLLRTLLLLSLLAGLVWAAVRWLPAIRQATEW
jgi:DNA-directed RNA polymerase specialized sigma24 family protein